MRSGTVENELNEVSRPPIELQNEQIERDIRSELFADDGETDWKINVTRVPTNQDGTAKKTREAVCFSVDRSGYDSLKQRLADHWGPGLYRLRVYQNGKLWGAEDMQIMVPHGWKPKPIPDENPAPSVAENQSLAQIIAQQMAENNRQLMEVLRENRQSVAPQSQTDILALLTGVMAIADKFNRRDVSPGMNPTTMMETMFGAFTKGMEMASSISSEGKETGMLDIAREAIKSFGPAIAEGMAQRQTAPTIIPQPVPQPLARPNPQQAQSNPAPQPTPAQQNEMQRMVQDGLVYLNRIATNDKDFERVDLYADWCLDDLNFPPTFIQTFLQTPNAMDQLQQMFPPIVPNRQWFERLLESVRRTISEMPTDDVDNASTDNLSGTAGGTGGDTGNAQTHVGANPESQEIPQH